MLLLVDVLVASCIVVIVGWRTRSAGIGKRSVRRCLILDVSRFLSKYLLPCRRVMNNKWLVFLLCYWHTLWLGNLSFNMRSQGWAVSWSVAHITGLSHLLLGWFVPNPRCYRMWFPDSLLNLGGSHTRAPTPAPSRYLKQTYLFAACPATSWATKIKPFAFQFFVTHSNSLDNIACFTHWEFRSCICKKWN